MKIRQTIVKIHKPVLWGQIYKCWHSKSNNKKPLIIRGKYQFEVRGFII